MNIEGLETAMRESAAKSLSPFGQGQGRLILNFPNNPTGYTPTRKRPCSIVAALKRLASEGIAVLAIVDDAYFGLQSTEGL
jgi:aspartate/methionine/tyrosine aminotransferase